MIIVLVLNLQAEAGKHAGAKQLKLQGISSRLVNGAAIFTERIKILDDNQMRLPCARLLWQACPNNTKTFDFAIGDLPDVHKAFVLPVTNASMVVDDAVASCMLSLLRFCESSVSQVTWLIHSFRKRCYQIHRAGMQDFFRTVDADRIGKPKPLVISSTCPTAGAEAAAEVPWHVARRSWSIVSHQSEGSAGECVRSHTRCWSRRCAGPASLQLPLLRESIQMLPCGLCCLSPRAPHTRS